MDPAVVSRELFQLRARSSHLRFKMRMAKNKHEEGQFAMRLEGIVRTQRWLKGVHRSLYERQLSRLSQQGSCRARSNSLPLLNRSQLKQPLPASCPV
jgi:hypothetical protein